MHNNIAEHAVAEITEPLAQVCAHLEPHLSKIQASWHKMLGRYAPCNKHAPLLSGLDVAQRMKDFCDNYAGIWRTDWEEQGQELARRGVPAECVGVAILLYVESCLPHLVSDNPRVVGWLRALLSWVRLYQYSLLSGYARQS